MNNLGRTLVVVGVIVLALLIGVLIGRGRRVEPTSEGAATPVQITTTAPVAEPAPAPLPAPVQAPPPAAIPKIAPDLQVQEDAAAVGMTTRESGDAEVTQDQPAPHSAADAGEDGQAQPAG